MVFVVKVAVLVAVAVSVVGLRKSNSGGIDR
jgi:hypothetical protein